MIVFPMAGLSRRFADAGYSLPKYMLPVGGMFCFDYSVLGFRQGYAERTFVFVMRDVAGTLEFVQQRLRALNIAKFKLVVLDAPTSGQGETVRQGIERSGVESGELAIFNVDTFRAGVKRPIEFPRGDGCLEVFVGSGDNWSFVKPVDGSDSRVGMTTEKRRVSELCCTGLYEFGTADLFLRALEAERRQPTSTLSETYIAPIYNQLIREGLDIRYHLIASEEVLFCGLPAEYEAIQREPAMLQRFGWNAQV